MARSYLQFLKLLPPARATRARNAPAGQTWCSGARRRLPQRGAASHRIYRVSTGQPPSQTPAVPAQPEPRAHLTSQPQPRRPPHPLAGRQPPAHAHAPPRSRPAPRQEPAARVVVPLRVGWVSQCFFRNASALTESLMPSWDGSCPQTALVKRILPRLCVFEVSGVGGRKEFAGEGALP